METLFKFGNADFANKIRASTYSVTPNARQDLDSYRDADGVLQRTALQHTATIVEFSTKSMREDEMRPLIDAMVGSYINFNERDAICTYYDFETGTMKTGHFYLDSNWKLSLYGLWNGVPYYNEVPFKFVEY